MSDLDKPAAVCGRAERTAAPGGEAQELRRKREIGRVLAVLVAAAGVAALAGSGRAAPMVPGGTAEVSGYEAAASPSRCPAGWRWQPSEYDRWSVWHPGHCIFERG